jgi:hypothetical protein
MVGERVPADTGAINTAIANIKAQIRIACLNDFLPISCRLHT